MSLHNFLDLIISQFLFGKAAYVKTLTHQFAVSLILGNKKLAFLATLICPTLYRDNIRQENKLFSW